MPLYQCTKCGRQQKREEGFFGHAICSCGYMQQEVSPSTVEDVLDLLSSPMFLPDKGFFTIELKPQPGARYTLYWREALKHGRKIVVAECDDLNDLFREFILSGGKDAAK